jgi:transcriptional regulator with XRE-family HTH domain
MTATDDHHRRRELADFLRTRRAALQPADVGLEGGGRRRTPGLRREEVAQLSGVGATWYTWLEQARDVRPSAQVLEALARALRLDAAERAHLFELGRAQRTPPPTREQVSPALKRLIDNLGPVPAFVRGRRLDYLAWNRAAEVAMGDPGDYPPGRRNALWMMFTDPTRPRLVENWEANARSLLAVFRAAHARNIDDPAFAELIAALEQVSPLFREWWPRHEVRGSVEGRKTINHPLVGRLVFEFALFERGEAPGQQLLLYSPLPLHDTPAKLARLLAGDEEGAVARVEPPAAAAAAATV